MPLRDDVMQVYETGHLTVVGFGGADPIDEIDIAGCRDQIFELVQLHDCKVLAFDLTDVKYISSPMLGLFASLTREGIEVHLYNISDDVRAVLDITGLGKLFTIHELVL
jgi:anti-sigma B factor antagonist